MPTPEAPSRCAGVPAAHGSARSFPWRRPAVGRPSGAVADSAARAGGARRAACGAARPSMARWSQPEAAQPDLGVAHRRQHARARRRRAALHRRRLPAQVRGRARAGADLACASPASRWAASRCSSSAGACGCVARAYAMVLQGGGVGVLYLTVFAALRLYALVPPVAAFVLLLWISALSSWLAVRQDAISLAALAVVGGFLAPILTSSGARQPRDAVRLLRAAQRGHLRHRVVQGVAPAQPAGLRVHVPRRHVLGRDALPAGEFRDDRAVPHPVLPVLRRDRRALRAAPLGRGPQLRRRGTRLRHAARRGRAAERARARHRIRDGVQRARDVRASIWRSAAISTRSTGDDIRLLVEMLPGARRRVRDAGRAARARRALDVRDVGARRRGDRLGGRAAAEGAVRAFGLLLQFGAGVAFVLGLSLWTAGIGARGSPVREQRIRRRGAGRARRLVHRVATAARGERVTEAERAFSGLVFAWGLVWWLFAFWREIDRWLPRDCPRSRRRVAAGRHRRRVRRAATAVALADGSRPGAVAAAGAGRARRRRDVARLWHVSDHVFAHGGFVAWPSPSRSSPRFSSGSNATKRPPRT